MNLLIYGGCHALIIKRLIDELGPTHRHRVDLLINFELVASGKPFPYERLKDYDAVIYSPVQNKGDYNTIFLDQACDEAGTQAIRFPWLEWHGYAPCADKDWFWGHHGWYFPDLISMSQDFSDLSEYTEHVRASFPSVERMRSVMSSTTDRLIEQEESFDCHVRVSKYILGNYRQQRMFLTPDHPSTALYRYVMKSIEKITLVPLIECWPSSLPELQPEERTPILPLIAAETGLQFTDTSWRCETQPLSTMTLEGFLALHFEAGRRIGGREGGTETVLATATRSTWAIAIEGSSRSVGPTSIPIFTQVLLRRSPPAENGTHFTGEVLDLLSDHCASEAHHRSLQGAYRFRTSDWIFRS